jgi:uncharacterized Fe-S cluster protein YjdI
MEKQIIKKYTKDDLTIVWQPQKCIHSAMCIKGLPEVFDNKARPWVKLDGAENQLIIDQVKACPSGALSYEINDPEAKKKQEPVTIMMLENGPLLIEGHFIITDKEGEPLETKERAALCRCGHSSRKPFCDGAHNKHKFVG